MSQQSERESSAPSRSRTSDVYDDNAALTEMAMPEPAEPDSCRQDSLEQEETRALSEQEQLEPSRRNRHRGTLTELVMPSFGSNISSRRAPEHEQDDIVCGGGGEEKQLQQPQTKWNSASLTHLYIISHLIFFAILGTLSRLGVTAITRYPRAPVSSPVLWANVGGSLVFGFLVEDRRLFREEWGTHSEQWSFKHLQHDPHDKELLSEASKRHRHSKTTIPLYIGLATGFCGSFTSFATFMLDAFLALSDQSGQTAQTSVGAPRHRGYDFEAVIGIMVIHVACSVGALKLGAHTALAIEGITPVLPFRLIRGFVDPALVVLGPGCWLGAIFLAAWPPRNHWRGQVLFALIFAPIGCLFRFYVSKHLNGRLPMFPTGTFTANVFGTAVLGMCYSLQRSGNISVLSCQILEGVIEGYCGCATTVSTWVGELETLQRRHAYIYGFSSLLVGLALLVVINGSLLWTTGFERIACKT